MTTSYDEKSPNNPQEGGRTRVDPLVGTVLDGRFQIDSVIGEGGMSVVYLATQLRVNRSVAIKTLRVQLDTKPVYRERFQREISLLCTLNHPHIVTVYDCVIGQDDQPYVVMDYLRGRSLEAAIREGGPLSINRFARIAVQVCSALDHAHRNGVIHRDLKPDNIVLMDTEMDFVKVVDFGLAKLDEDHRKLTKSGELWGSPPYMSPEQCMSKPEDERSDIYSFGIVMYEMLAGKDPFHNATSVLELIQTHVNTPPPRLIDTNPNVNVPAKVEAVIFKAMAKDPRDRWQNALELRDAIIDACADSNSKDSGDLMLLAGSIRESSGAGDRARLVPEDEEQSAASPSDFFNRALDPLGGLTISQMLKEEPVVPQSNAAPHVVSYPNTHANDAETSIWAPPGSNQAPPGAPAPTFAPPAPAPAPVTPAPAPAPQPVQHQVPQYQPEAPPAVQDPGKNISNLRQTTNAPDAGSWLTPGTVAAIGAVFIILFAINSIPKYFNRQPSGTMSTPSTVETSTSTGTTAIETGKEPATTTDKSATHTVSASATHALHHVKQPPRQPRHKSTAAPTVRHTHASGKGGATAGEALDSTSHSHASGKGGKNPWDLLDGMRGHKK